MEEADSIINSKIPHNVLEFDGYCALCNLAVNVVLKFDKTQKIKVRVLSEDPNFKNDTLYFWNNGIRLEKSDAVFAIIEQLKGGFLLFRFFKILPKRANDAIYGWISRNRYSIFGKRSSCRIPTEKDKNRFIS